MKRQQAERSGRDGEARAALWLRAKGWQVLDRRVKTAAGEIDLVVKRGRLVAFIEVKWRQQREELDHAIDQHRLARVAAATDAVAHRYAKEGEDIRVDVILLAPGTFPRHIANAWQP